MPYNKLFYKIKPQLSIKLLRPVTWGAKCTEETTNKLPFSPSKLEEHLVSSFVCLLFYKSELIEPNVCC